MVFKSNNVEVAPYWNVNRFEPILTDLYKFVEVAPYWNVNTQGLPKCKLVGKVEVAPYWNVNILYKSYISFLIV